MNNHVETKTTRKALVIIDPTTTTKLIYNIYNLQLPTTIQAQCISAPDLSPKLVPETLKYLNNARTIIIQKGICEEEKSTIACS